MEHTEMNKMGHSHTLSLFDPAKATHVAVKNGNWTDPSSWKGGKVPGPDAKVHIPEGISLRYDSQSQARLETVRVDGALDFATRSDTYMKVENFFTGPQSRLTIGTKDDPVAADVTAKVVIADGPIDLKADPGRLGNGLVAEGRVEVHGAEKASYATLDGAAKAGAKSIKLEAGAQGWTAGDKIVVMGTKQGKFQDEEREIVSVRKTDGGVELVLDKALSHDHAAPAGHDLDVYVGNASRNVVFTSENPEGVRGHVMMMHNPDAQIRYAEFDELGRTDKSRPLHENGNVEARYPLHLHETGTSPDSGMAVLEGNSVHGSPGWGIVQHSSRAAVDYNFVYDIDGAGIVSEDGDETGQWVGNFVTGIKGAGEDFSVERDEHKADFGHSGVAYENQARQIVQQDNIAANSNTAWMFRAAEISVDNPDRGSLDFDPAPLKAELNNEEPAIVGFHRNKAIAVDTVLDTGHRQDMASSTDLRSDMIELTAWEVQRVLDIFNYTGEYVIRDGLFIGADNAGRAVVLPEKHESTSFVNTHFENFRTAVFDRGGNSDGVYVGNSFANVGKRLVSDYYGDERLQSGKAAKTADRPKVEIDPSSDLTLGPRDDALFISGKITDSVGTLGLGTNRWVTTPSWDEDGIDSTDNKMGHPKAEQLIELHGAMRDGDGWVMPFALWVTDRGTGEHHAYRIDVKLEGFSDEYLAKHQIDGFKLPSGEIRVIDSGAAVMPEGGHDLPKPQPETPKTEEPKTEEPKVEEPKVEAPVEETPTPETPETDEPKAEMPEDEAEDAPAPSQPATPGAGGTPTKTVGEALRFDGTGVAVPEMRLEDDFTVEAWVKLEPGKNINAADAILGSSGFDLSFLNGRLTVRDGSDVIAKSEVAAQAGEWTHYAVVRDAGEVRVYLDGAEVGRSVGDWNDAVTFNMLGDGQTRKWGLTGEMDDVAVWSEARSAEEIAAGIPQAADGLVAGFGVEAGAVDSVKHSAADEVADEAANEPADEVEATTPVEPQPETEPAPVTEPEAETKAEPETVTEPETGSETTAAPAPAAPEEISPDEAAAWIVGGDGRDRLYGTDAADLLRDGLGDDKMYGGAGDDVFHFEGGRSDRAWGGEGADMFDIRPMLANDRGDKVSIEDFEIGVDMFPEGLFEQVEHVRSNDRGTVLHFDGGDRLRIAGVTDPAELSFADLLIA
ncbi:LamG-like jellyroll fold domain-containing protein [Limimaricola pyoseonensis]|uniref:Hemolysin-type calcium-binding repeat-containing protein n=1 Tax=Limimaricola pyoseonensis TaxID=521013 RepID=A0A1G7IZQ1_9RHOB|nr:LamG-like jellyroll fold domain-containing protein [Limimaricola pyoseonensis]SDF18034.1 Hemolysin-type calcium-binding repeat-containing protein [Limimaricola pyoseonensis]